ncbi:hypothetical protein AgCh_013888 [Apium graveolens]
MPATSARTKKSLSEEKKVPKKSGKGYWKVRAKMKIYEDKEMEAQPIQSTTSSQPIVPTVEPVEFKVHPVQYVYLKKLYVNGKMGVFNGDPKMMNGDP